MGKKRRAEEKAAKDVKSVERISAAAGEPEAEEKRTVPTMSKQEARAAVLSEKKEKKYRNAAAAAGVILFLLVCLNVGRGEKATTLIAMLAGIGIFAWKRRTIGSRFGVVSLMLTAYCAMITASSFYAPAGKFALIESIHYILALVILLAVLGFEPDRGRKTGCCSATAVALSSAIISLLSVDFAGARLISAAVLRVFNRVTDSYGTLSGVAGHRINTIFGNVNIFSGVAGIGILLGLGLLSAVEVKRERRLHLVCLCVNAAAFLMALSRGAMAVLAVAFVAYLFLERGEKRAKALVLMVETLVFAGISALAGFMTGFGANEGTRFIPLLVLAVCATALTLCDETVGRGVANKVAPHTGAVTAAILSLLGAAAVFAVAALNLVGPLSLDAGQTATREFYPAAGETDLVVSADGEVQVNVTYQPTLDSFAWDQKPLYYGSAGDAHFVVPEDCEVAFVTFAASEAVTISDAQFIGTESGSIKLDYRLLPENIATGLQGLFTGQSFMQRRVLWRTGLQLWRESPIVGLGIGAFENKSLGVMQFHFETKYVHNHYIQSLVDTGAVGLALFLAVLLSSTAALVLARRRDGSNSMLPALGACLLFMAGQACTDIVFSAPFYLPGAFAVFALIELCCGDALRVPMGEKAARLLPHTAPALIALWIVLLGANLYAAALCSNPTYESFAKAAKIDRYERNEYCTSYVFAACTDEARTESVTAQMYEYMEKLEKVPSNSIPYYLGYAYFNLGDTAKAFEMLGRFTAYSASDEENWDKAYRLALSYANGSAAYMEGLSALYQSMLDWNESSLSPIVLMDDIYGVITALTGME